MRRNRRPNARSVSRPPPVAAGSRGQDLTSPLIPVLQSGCARSGLCAERGGEVARGSCSGGDRREEGAGRGPLGLGRCRGEDPAHRLTPAVGGGRDLDAPADPLLCFMAAPTRGQPPGHDTSNRYRDTVRSLGKAISHPDSSRGQTRTGTPRRWDR